MRTNETDGAAKPNFMGDLPRLKTQRRTGDERFTDGEQKLPITIRDFWCWSTSDLLSNTTRGVLAEFLVATALGIASSGVRDPWAAYDLEADGLKIEVKSSAYLQSWFQKRPSSIAFDTPKTRAWDPDTNAVAADSARQADVYVFAVLIHTDKNTVNPLDVSQWEFYVLPTSALNSELGARRSITLKALQGTSAGPVTFDRLAARIRHVGVPPTATFCRPSGATD